MDPNREQNRKFEGAVFNDVFGFAGFLHVNFSFDNLPEEEELGSSFYFYNTIARTIRELAFPMVFRCIFRYDAGMVYLDDWASFEIEHINSLYGVVEDLEASTLRVPLTGGAKILNH